MITGILPKNRMGSKSVWLLDIGNNNKAGVGLKVVIVSTGDRNDMGISSLNIYAIETGSSVRINCLGVTSSTLDCEEATTKN